MSRQRKKFFVCWFLKFDVLAFLLPSSSYPADSGAGNTVKQSDLASCVPTLEREDLSAPDGQLRLEKPFLCSVTQAAAVPFARWIAVRFCKTTAIIAHDLLANGSWRILFLLERRRMLTAFIKLLPRRLQTSRAIASDFDHVSHALLYQRFNPAPARPLSID